MIGHIAESGQVMAIDFRDGNVASAAANLKFTKQCEAALPAGVKVSHFRTDAGSCQTLFDTLHEFINDNAETGSTVKFIYRQHLATVSERLCPCSVHCAAAKFERYRLGRFAARLAAFETAQGRRLRDPLGSADSCGFVQWLSESEHIHARLAAVCDLLMIPIFPA